jgi:hypothetical protein
MTSMCWRERPRRRHRPVVLGLDATAGEADLAGVVAQMVGAARQQQVQAGLPLHQRHQHGGARGLAIGEQAAVARELGRPGRPGRQAGPDGRRRQCEVGNGGEMVVDARDGDELRLGDGRTGHASEKTKAA